MPRKLKINSNKHSLMSKSVPPRKRLRNNPKLDYNTSRNNKNKKINLMSNYKSEDNIEK